MAAVVMATGKRVGGLAYALQSYESLEFNSVGKDELMRADGKQCALFITLHAHAFFFLFCI